MISRLFLIIKYLANMDIIFIILIKTNKKCLDFFSLLNALRTGSQPLIHLLACLLKWSMKEGVRIIAAFSAGKIRDGSH